MSADTQQQIRDLERQQGDVNKLYIAGSMDRPEYQRAIQALHAEISRLAGAGACACSREASAR